MSGLFWLASYPRSGNTWLRAFLTNYRRDQGQPVAIDDLEGGPIASSRTTFDESIGVEASALSLEEIDSLRPEVYRCLAASAVEPLFLKVHDAYRHALIPPDVTLGAVYIIRDPLDVAVSLAAHIGVPLDEAIRRMGDESFALGAGGRRLKMPLRQRLLSWSGHVLSWLEQAAIPVHVMRYEDMHAKPLETFMGALRFSRLPVDADRIRRAHANSCFEVLRRQEQTFGFEERPRASNAFFRKGQVGSWKEVLDRAQMDRLLRDHGAVMQRFGYGRASYAGQSY